jgi:hypothetical protein
VLAHLRQDFEVRYRQQGQPPLDVSSTETEPAAEANVGDTDGRFAGRHLVDGIDWHSQVRRDIRDLPQAIGRRGRRGSIPGPIPGSRDPPRIGIPLK